MGSESNEKWVPVCGYCQSVDIRKLRSEQRLKDWRMIYAERRPARGSCVLCHGDFIPIGEGILNVETKKTPKRKKTAKKRPKTKPKPAGLYPPWPKA